LVNSQDKFFEKLDNFNLSAYPLIFRDIFGLVLKTHPPLSPPRMWHFLSTLIPTPSMAIAKQNKAPSDLHSETSPKWMSNEDILRPDRFDPEPELATTYKALDLAISNSNHKSAAKGHKKLHDNMDFNMDLDDSDQQDGGVSLVSGPSSSATSFQSSATGLGIHTHFSPSSPSSQPSARWVGLANNTKLRSSPSPKSYAKGLAGNTDLSPSPTLLINKPGLPLTINTDLPSPKSEQFTPNTYIRSPLTTIQEEHDTNADVKMDLSFVDDEEMPDLEDSSTSLDLPSSLPGSWPDFSKTFQTKYGPSSPSSLKKEIEDAPPLPPRHFSLPESKKSRLCNEIDTVSFDDELPISIKNEDGDGDEKKVGWGDVRIEWDMSLWPPENVYEREFCERVCEEVAVANGFQKVVIK
jgi:hypothetical protein